MSDIFTNTGSTEIKVLHMPSEQEPFYIIDKPGGLPSAPLKEEDASAMTQLISMCPELKLVNGRKTVEFGLVHRIDTATRGLLVVAAAQDFYDFILEQQNAGNFVKKYTALCEKILKDKNVISEKNSTAGNQNRSCASAFLAPDKIHIKNCELSLDDGYPPRPEISYKTESDCDFCCVVKSKFRPYGLSRKEVRPVTEKSGHAANKKASPSEYITNVHLEKLDGSLYKAECSISKGYRHQVRCHLAWLGYPIKGDMLYNKEVHQDDDFCFAATEIQFPLMNGQIFQYKLF